jgi:hypothetical protein
VAHVTVEPALIEHSVTREIERRRALGNSRFFNEYHAEQERVHELPVDDRARAVRILHERFFDRLGFAALVPELLAESRDLDRRALVCEGTDEGAYLSPDGATILLRVRPERFADLEDARRWLRRELAQLRDLLDPAFGARDHVFAGPDGPIVQERFAALWSIVADARLAREGRGTIADREAAFLRFDRAWPKLTLAQRQDAFRSIWEKPRWTQAGLIDLAAHPWAGAAPRTGPVAGALCPLCRFPTHAWVVPGSRLDDSLADLIVRDYPGWRPEQGLCERCIELCEVRAGRWWSQSPSSLLPTEH